MKFPIAILCGILVVAATAGQVTVTNDSGRGPSAELQTGNGKATLRIEPRNWDNTQIVTESGKRWRLVDPFLYNLRDAKFSYYLSHQTLWPLVKAEVLQNGSALFLESAPPELGLKKSAMLQLIPGFNAVLATVSTETVASKIIRVVYNNQNIYLSAPFGDFELWLDGKLVGADGKETLRNFKTLCFYQAKLDFSIALILFPGDHTFSMLNLRPEKGTQNFDISWGTSPVNCRPGTALVQNYIVAWGDGDLHDKLAEIVKQSEMTKR